MNLFGTGQTVYLVSAVLALLAAILVFVYVMPKSRDGKLSPFWQFLHDLFHFKRLYLESILKFLYAFATFLAFFTGFIGLILGLSDALEDGVWMPALVSLGIMLLGPVALRIVYEFAMMGILLVLNVMEINRKLKREPGRREDLRAGKRMQPAPQPVRYTYCKRCGGKYEASLPVCPHCGRANV